MAKKKVKNLVETEESNTETTVLDSSTKETMCIISQSVLQEVYNWVNSDRMVMPHNEVLRCQKLLLTAKVVQFSE